MGLRGPVRGTYSCAARGVGRCHRRRRPVARCLLLVGRSRCPGHRRPPDAGGDVGALGVRSRASHESIPAARLCREGRVSADTASDLCRIRDGLLRRRDDRGVAERTMAGLAGRSARLRGSRTRLRATRDSKAVWRRCGAEAADRAAGPLCRTADGVGSPLRVPAGVPALDGGVRGGVSARHPVRRDRGIPPLRARLAGAGVDRGGVRQRVSVRAGRPVRRPDEGGATAIRSHGSDCDRGRDAHLPHGSGYRPSEVVRAAVGVGAGSHVRACDVQHGRGLPRVSRDLELHRRRCVGQSVPHVCGCRMGVGDPDNR